MITGGQFDVDVTLSAPDNTVLYSVQKEQYGQFDFKPKAEGVYQVRMKKNLMKSRFS